MKYLLFFLCFVIGCVPLPPKEVTLKLPNATPVTRHLPPLHQTHYLTEEEFKQEKKELQKECDNILAEVGTVEWSLRHQIYRIQESMESILTFMLPDMPEEDVRDIRRKIAKYKELNKLIIQMESEISQRILDIEVPPDIKVP